MQAKPQPAVPRGRTILEGRYRLWYDRTARLHRWALVHWPDDGSPNFGTHGSEPDLEGAVRACEKNDADRRGA